MNDIIYADVPKDLMKIKTKFLFNLTKRQLCCFGGGALVGVPLYFLTRDALPRTVSMLLMIGVMTRRKANSVDGFVLGGRSAGPWLTAFGYGTSYFSAVVFVGYAGQFGFKYGISATWAGIGNAVLGSLLA